jgi:lysophospholipase L1-like esterase
VTQLFRYVALGDSTGLGIGNQSDGGYPERLFHRLKAAGFNAGILNLAQSGATTREVVQGQVQKAVSMRPSLVTLGVGTNDLWRMVPLGTFEMNLKLIANQLEASRAEVVVSSLVDLTQAPIAGAVETFLRIPRALFSRRVHELNERLTALARRPRFTVVDMFSFSARELASHPEYFSADGFHPSSVGYDRWAELMWPAVQGAAERWQEQRRGATPN